MQSRCSLFVALLGLCCSWAARWPGTAHADTVQTFDAPGTEFAASTLVNPPAPALVAGPSGNLLRLAAAGPTMPIHNTIAFRRSDPGPFCGMNAQFDLRITPGVGQADGMGFALLDTAPFWQAGPVSVEGPLFAAEEPNFRRSLGVGFDVYDNGGEPNANHVSIHWNGSRLTQVSAGAVDLSSSSFVHVEIVLTTGSPATVTVRLTPDGSPSPTTVIDALPIPGLRPYEGRVWFGARSGGESADHDLDNVDVTFSACPSSQVGEWTPVANWPQVAIHSHLLPDGRVLFWSRLDCFDPPCSGTPFYFDPGTGIVTQAPAQPPGHDLFCTGHVLLPNGRLFVTGGHVEDLVGLALTSIFNPVSGTWRVEPPMQAGRWYPTATALANGDVLVISGNIDNTLGLNRLPEIWQRASRTWRPLTSALRTLSFYPWMFLAPNGQVFVAGPDDFSAYFDTAGTGAITPIDVSSDGFREYGSAVLYDDGKVMIAGGGQFPPKATVEVIDLGQPTPQWRTVAPMAAGRIQLTLTLLADGTVLATGGTASPGFTDSLGAVLTPELWDPTTETWATLAAGAEARLYHSTALLLPDARVLVAGGGHPNGGNDDVNHRTAEIFSPPYLFRGPRPTLTSAPAGVRYGQSFFVETPDAATVTSITWVRLGSVTHAFNQNQRINRLAFAAAPGGLTVTAPSDPNLSPPGHHMLFLLGADGVPSVAKIVQLKPQMIFSDGFESGDLSSWPLQVP